MPRWIIGSVAVAALGAILGNLPASSAQGLAGQDDMKSTVTFDTVDDAKLTGTFYKGPKGSESPCAILVHRFGSDRSKGGWAALAADLQSKLGFSVLTFDLRGHGQSKSVKDKFWDYTHNKNGIRGGYNSRNKTEIAFNEFKSSYWPILFNDLVAARYYLDQENDAQRCNSSSIVVIGAQEGAGLGMGWITYEYDRTAVSGGATGVLTGNTLRIVGEDIAAGVWLGPVGRGTGGMAFRPTDWFAKPFASKMRENTSMYFLFGKQDSLSASVVPGYLAAIKRPADGKTPKAGKLDKDEALATKLPGQDLLGNPGLDVNGKIVKYLEEVMSKRGNPAWKRQDPRSMQVFPIGNFGYSQP